MRKYIFYVVAGCAIVSAACSQPVAPKRDDTSCRSGISISSGNRCDE